MKDPNGNALRQVLLQIIDKDECGPIMLRVRRDHERIDLSEGTPTFMIVWAPEDQILGELRLSDVLAELEEVKRQQAESKEMRVLQSRDLARFERDLAAKEKENEQKTAALRELQKERDPERFDRAVKERTAELQRALEAANNAGIRRAADLERRIAELETSKKKLRERISRLEERR